MNILVCNENQTLDEIGIHINKYYPNIRFLFEIDFSKDDYIQIKKLFQQEYTLQNTYFKDDFFIKYFRNNTNHRIPFLVLLVGFVRYEYLNNENQANFFDNFLKHILQNDKADAKDFRKSLIDYFFRWRGKKKYDEKGLYIYDIQTSEVSLKLEDGGKNKYLNSFIFHSGGVSEQDLKEYLKIIKYLFEESTETSNLNQLYKDKDFTVYSKKLDNLFRLLDSESEIARYIQKFIIQSIAIISNNEVSYNFKLPLYIRNYLLFIGKYGDSLEKINIDETDFIYENQSIVFTPRFHELYKQIDQISFKINNQIIHVNKEYDIYTMNDFDIFKVPIDNIENMFTIELLIDDNFFKRYDINLFKQGFLLLDNDFNIKNIFNKEIYVPQRDEEKKYYIVSTECLDLELSDKDIDDYFIYDLPLNMDTLTIDIANESYSLYFSPIILSTIQYEDESFLYTSELPKFRISSKDKEKFVAINLFDNSEFNYNEFYNYGEPIGKFAIKINQLSFKVAYIDGFEIRKWFNWFDNDKVFELKLSDEKIKTNSDEVDIEDGSYIHTFNLKDKNNIIVFNQINGNNIQLELLKPTVIMSFLDKRKNETKIKSKNIKFERLNFYRQLKVELLNYPSSIKFDTFKVGINEFEVMKHNNSYFIPIKKIKELSEEIEENHLSIILKNNYYFLSITDIIFDNQLIENRKNREEIKIDDIHFLMNNSENIKYYFNNRAYFIDGFEIMETDRYRSEMLILKEARETRESKIIKKNFRNIKEDGLYVELKDIDYE